MAIKVTIDGEFHQVSNKPGETILETLIRNNIDVPYSCKLGYCSVCKCKLESGQIDVDDDFILTRGEKSVGYILACQSFPKSEVSITYDYL